MRILLKIKTTKEIIPYDHQHLLTGVIHKWLGFNNEHGLTSLYSFSRLEAGYSSDRGIAFHKDTGFFFSAFEPKLVHNVIKGVMDDPTMFNGLIVNEINILEDPDLSHREHFLVASPIFIKRKINERDQHVLYNDPAASLFLEETLRTKIKMAGIELDLSEVRFDSSYNRAKTMKITYKGIENKANWCPVIIKGSAEAKLFVWNVGLGNSTGIGFGAIK